MDDYGFSGAGNLISICYKQDMVAFFKLVEEYAVNDKHDDWDIITNRLYRHYIGREDWDRAIILTEEIKNCFSKIDSKSIDWKQYLDSETKLHIDRDNLALVFKGLLESILYLIEGGKFYDNSKESSDFYYPIRTVPIKFSSSGYLKNLSLAEYDAVEGTPLWLRDDPRDPSGKSTILDEMQSPPVALNNTGFTGGRFMAVLGYQTDMSAFFKCVNDYGVNDAHDDWRLITDRLYCRYIAREDWDRSLELMKEIEASFANIDGQSVDWDALLGNKTLLDITGDNLAIIFEKFFIQFAEVIDDAHCYYNERGKYEPIKTILTDDEPFQYYYKTTLEEYDALTGDPFWLRDMPT